MGLTLRCLITTTQQQQPCGRLGKVALALLMKPRGLICLAAPNQDHLTVEQAESLARLWVEGKLIGGDAHAVCAALLREIDRLKA